MARPHVQVRRWLATLVAVVAASVVTIPADGAGTAAPPTVTSLSAMSGTLAGGQRITVRGTHFAHVTAVRFGDARGTKVRVRSATKLTVTVPSRSAAGSIQVRVTTRAGTSRTGAGAKFTYVPDATVTTTGSTSCLVTSDHRGFCWGENIFGTVGNGTAGPDPVLAPDQVPGRWRSIVVNDSSACGIKADGTGWCWGLVGTATPTQVPGQWSSLEPGGYLVCGIKAAGSLWCWGGNTLGQTGTGSSDGFVPAPTRVGPASARWATVTNASTSACAIRTSGRAFCWGDDQFGQVGNGAATGNVLSPFSLGSGWTQIDARQNVACGVQDGVGRCWGYNYYGGAGNGAAGDPPYADVVSPTAVAGGGTWSRILPDGNLTCGVRTNGSGWCWGGDGLGAGSTVTASTSPVSVGAGRWRSIDPGAASACGVRVNGSLWCWGSNSVGTVGDGTTSDRDVPTRLDGTWTSAGIGTNTTCAVATDNSVWCWGQNYFGTPMSPQVTGAVGNGTGDHQLTPYQLPGTP
jgi:alpha-tubulin suppressor-like RCC1 family protein